MANGFAINKGLANVAARRGGLAGSGKIFTRGTTLWHRLNVPVGGSQSFSFFNASRSAGVTNLEQAGTLPANTVALVKSVRFSFLPGFDVLGRRIGVVGTPTTAQLQASTLNLAAYGTTAADPLAAISPQVLWSEKVRELLSHGNAIMRVGEREIFNVWGLTKFPEGRGVVNDVHSATALSNSTATTVNTFHEVFNSVFNGAPLAGNVWRLEGDVQIASGQQFGIDVNYLAPVAFDQATVGPLNGITGAITAGTLMCELDVLLSTPAQ